MIRYLHVSNPAVVAATAMLILFVSSGGAGAALVMDDFSYPAGPLMTRAGGSGWTGSWGASSGTGTVSSRVLVDDTFNLTSSLYLINQTGVGHTYGNYNGFRGVNRYLDANMSGTVWFSVLLQNTAAGHHAGIQFNNHVDAPFTGQDYNQGPWHVDLAGSDLIVRYNSANSASLASLGLNQTHLILGRLTLGAGNDRMEVWADPADLYNLGTPLFDLATGDMGASLYLAGILGYGPSDGATNPAIRQGFVDALRISDGGGNPLVAFGEVTGVEAPEPATLALLACSVAGLARYVRRRPA